MLGMIRFGILGFGLHAEKRLVPAFHHTQSARLVALSRRDADKARAAARTHGIRLAFGSAEELCACQDVDAVVVATPNACHYADTLLALQYKKPVLCEKPMALNAAQCRRMIVAAQKAGALLGVAQVFRFANSIARFRERVAGGEIGRPLLARAEFCYPGEGHPRQWLYSREIAGGGVLADVGVHCIDVLRFVLNDEITQIGARARLDRPGGVDVVSSLLLEFSRGTLAVVQTSTRTAYRTALELVGDKGVLRSDNALSVDAPVRIERCHDGEIVDSERLSNADAFAVQLDAFARAVEGNEKFLCPGEEGLRNQLVLDTAYAAIDSAPAL